MGENLGGQGNRYGWIFDDETAPKPVEPQQYHAPKPPMQRVEPNYVTDINTRGKNGQTVMLPKRPPKPTPRAYPHVVRRETPRPQVRTKVNVADGPMTGTPVKQVNVVERPMASVSEKMANTAEPVQERLTIKKVKKKKEWPMLLGVFFLGILTGACAILGLLAFHVI